MLKLPGKGVCVQVTKQNVSPPPPGGGPAPGPNAGAQYPRVGAGRVRAAARIDRRVAASATGVLAIRIDQSPIGRNPPVGTSTPAPRRSATMRAGALPAVGVTPHLVVAARCRVPEMPDPT